MCVSFDIFSNGKDKWEQNKCKFALGDFYRFYSHLEAPPDPGDPFSVFAPSFAFGFDCLSSLESLQTQKSILYVLF